MSKPKEEERALLAPSADSEGNATGGEKSEAPTSPADETLQRANSRVLARGKAPTLPADLIELHIPQPADLLPSMVEVGWKLAELKKEDPNIFMVRGRNFTEQNFNVEKDQALLEKVIMETIEGKTWRETASLFWYRFRHKSQLIKTIQALECIRQRAQVVDNDISKLMVGERKSYARQGLLSKITSDTENIFYSVATKLNQVLFLMIYLSYGTPGSYDPHKAIVVKPDPRLKNKAAVPEELQDTLAAYFEEGEEFQDDSVLPIHPEWLAHDIPLSETAWFQDIWLEAQTSVDPAQGGDPASFVNKLSFFRMLVTRIEGSLSSQLDTVTTMQQKLLGLMMTIALALLNYFRHQIDVEDLLHLSIDHPEANITERLLSAVNITGSIHI